MNGDFAAMVEHSIQRMLDRDEPVAFSQLVGSLPGTDPNFIHAIVTQRNLSAKVTWSTVKSQYERHDRRLPVPHPLDYDWRFTRGTLAELCDEFSDRNARNVTLLGAPSLWLALESDQRFGSARLVDADPQLRRAGRGDLIVADLLVDAIDVDGPQADLIFADPPWYPDATKAFLSTAATLVAPGGCIYLSVPQIGTRPGIITERNELVGWARNVGLELAEQREAGVRYSMPPFERNALRASGLLPYVPFDWRRGDLMIFKKTVNANGRLHRPGPRPRPASTWVERMVDDVRIRVRTDRATGQSAALLQLVPGDVLPSVSRRDARRDAAQVWTSGNRVFACEAPATLIEIIDALVAEIPPPRGTEEICAQVQHLVRSERREYIELEG